MKELYQKLFQSCEKLQGFHHAAHFVAMKGKYYDTNTKRLLLVGRATNGWDSLEAEDAEGFGEQAERLFYDPGRWDWIDVVDGVLYSVHNDGNHKKKKDRYCVSTSPFWYYTKAIWQELPGTSKDCVRWMENIAWSNLFKVSPKVEGNPTTEYINAQKEVCNEILYREIEVLKPTHILFMTGYDWFMDFAGCFQNIKHLGSNKIGKNRNDVYMEATAEFQGIKAAVMCRPEYREKDLYVRSSLCGLMQ